MSIYLVVEEPEIVAPGECLMCQNRARRLYTMDDGSTLLVCSVRCLLDATVSTDGERADGVMTEAQCEASIAKARRAQKENE